MNEHVDKVEMAAEATRRGIDRLVQLLTSKDEDVATAAIVAMDDLGARAVVGPLVAALPRADEGHRGLIVLLLGSYGREERLWVLQALHSAQESERSPWVAKLIAEALLELSSSDDAPCS